MIALLGIALILVAGCESRPVACKKFDVSSGSRPSLTTFDRAVNTRTWSECRDGKVREVTCPPGHLSNWKCHCTIKNETITEIRADQDFPDERGPATAMANQLWKWHLQ